VTKVLRGLSPPCKEIISIILGPHFPKLKNKHHLDSIN
jgi:hypothetical protein